MGQAKQTSSMADDKDVNKRQEELVVGHKTGMPPARNGSRAADAAAESMLALESKIVMKIADDAKPSTTNAAAAAAARASLSTLEQDALAKEAARPQNANSVARASLEALEDKIAIKTAAMATTDPVTVATTAEQKLTTFEQDLLAKGGILPSSETPRVLLASFEDEVAMKIAARTPASAAAATTQQRLEQERLANETVIPKHSTARASLASLEDEVNRKATAMPPTGTATATKQLRLTPLDQDILTIGDDNSTDPHTMLSPLENYVNGNIFGGGSATPAAYTLDQLPPGAYSAQGGHPGPPPSSSFTTQHQLSISDVEQPEASAREGNTEEGLAVARKVFEGNPPIQLDLPIAQLEGNRKTNLQAKVRSFRLRACMWFLCGVLLLVVAIVIPVILLQNDGDTSIVVRPAEDLTSSPTQAPTLSPNDAALQALLPDYTVNEILLNQDSPQAQAYQWMLSDPLFKRDNTHWRLSQRFALATLFYAAGGENWTHNDNWLDYEKHECHWFSRDDYKSVRAFDTYNPMEHVHLNPCNLPTSSSDEIREEDMQEYQQLWLQGNNLKGSIPPEMFLLSSLRSVALRANQDLSGPIPTQVGLLNQLEAFAVSFTAVSGSIPSEFGALSPILRSLTLSVCQFSGTMPTELGRLARLHELMLDANRLSGAPPTELGNLSNLHWIMLAGNLFTGTFPAWVTRLSKLEEVHLEMNSFHGSVPTEIGQLKGLKTMSFFESGISGPIPTEVGLLTKVRKLYLDSNWITGTLPSEIGQLTGLANFWAGWADLTGTIPSELGQCSWLYYLMLGGTLLSGTIPTELGNLPGNLSLIPTNHVEFDEVMTVDLNSCFLTGPIPSELGSRESLIKLNLENNQFSGFIPSELGMIHSLEYLWLGTNGLSGTIPPEIGLMSTLNVFNLTNNPFISGIVPVPLCEYTYFDCTEIACGCDCSCATLVDANSSSMAVSGGTANWSSSKTDPMENDLV